MTIKLRTSDIIIVCGRIETGKTTLLRHLTRHIRRRIYWDFNHEHSLRGYVVHYVNQIRENFLERGLSVVFQPLRKRDEDFLEFIEEVSTYNNVTLILEELERYARGGKRSFLPAPLEDIIDTGSHHKGQGLFVTCRRIGDLHRKVFFNAHHIFALEQHRPQDIKYLADTLGTKAYMLHSESAEKHGLEPLPPYYFLHYDHKTTHVRKKVSP